MKSKDYIVIGLAMGFIFLLVYLLQNKAKVNIPEIGLGLEGAPGPPATEPLVQGPTEQPQANNILYDTETGQGGAAVKQRMRSVWSNATEREALIARSGLINQAYQGLKYPTGIQNAMAGIFGAASRLPLVPDSIEPSYSTRAKEWNSVPDFETLTASQGGDPTQAFSTWKAALNLQDAGLNFWPPNILALIEAQEFGPINRGDRNRSEKYREFTNDMKVLGQNIAFINKKLDELVKDKAIADLRAAGWNFLGYDTPPAGSRGR